MHAALGRGRLGATMQEWQGTQRQWGRVGEVRQQLQLLLQPQHQLQAGAGATAAAFLLQCLVLNGKARGL